MGRRYRYQCSAVKNKKLWCWNAAEIDGASTKKTSSADVDLLSSDKTAKVLIFCVHGWNRRNNLKDRFNIFLKSGNGIIHRINLSSWHNFSLALVTAWAGSHPQAEGWR